MPVKSSAARKEKGRRLQKWAAEKVSQLTGLECGPDCPIESRPMGQNGPDIRLDNEARKCFPWTVETKNQETWAVPAAIKQCKANLYKGTNWLLIFAKAYFKPIVILDAEVFFDLLEKLKGKGEAPKNADPAQNNRISVCRRVRRRP